MAAKKTTSTTRGKQPAASKSNNNQDKASKIIHFSKMGSGHTPKHSLLATGTGPDSPIKRRSHKK